MLDKILQEIEEHKSFISCTISSPIQKSEPAKKITIRTIEKDRFLITEQKGPKAIHQTVLLPKVIDMILESSTRYKQIVLYTTLADYHLLRSAKGKVTALKKVATKTRILQPHNRPKNYLLEEGTCIPFLVSLGIMNEKGQIISSKRDKFAQVNRFLEFIQDVLSEFEMDKPLHIIDYGCGSALLTFALYHYLTQIVGYQVTLWGLDLKKEVIDKCQTLANQLEFHSLKFKVEDINQHTPDVNIDLVISLHACDTATDAAIEKGVLWGARVILAVPCCQHELFHQIENSALRPLLKEGILKERFASLVTDAARAQILSVLGYQTQVLEFIDLEHTPKNVMIRAIKREQRPRKEHLEEYLRFKETLHITPSLEKRLFKFNDRFE